MSSANTKTKHIIIVEDNKDMREFYKIFFSDQAEKYTIEIIDNPNAAMERVKRKDFDLLILDIIMQPISGDSVCVYLRQNLNDQDTPVIMLSVLEPIILKHLKEMNNVTILQKPITKEQLLTQIDKILF